VQTELIRATLTSLYLSRKKSYNQIRDLRICTTNSNSLRSKYWTQKEWVENIMKQWAIQAHDLRKTFGDFVAVDDLSFEVSRGEIFALIGPNGAGKSTTIRMVLDILKPDSGNVSVLGGHLTEDATNRIGYLPEERGLYKNVSLIRLLTYLGQLKGMSRQDAQTRGKALMEQLELGEYVNSKLTALSKGMAQKVQFIATILHHPELIIIDEPFSGLDPVNTGILKDLLYDTMRQDGTAIVMSTHQMLQLQEMAGRMLMIAKGRRVLYGEVDAIRQEYASNALLVTGEGDWSALQGVTLVDGQRNGDILLQLQDTTTADDVLAQIAAGDYRLRRFELAIPGLEEIFIRVAGGEVHDTLQ
jgi:ABC-2 type transport system ATP-binding protein